MAPKEYEKFVNFSNLPWQCPACKLPNLSDSFFMDNSSLEMDNSFSVLSENDTSQSVEEPEEIPQKTPGSIRFLGMNCQSIRRENRWTMLNSIISTYQPDVIHLTETHLDQNISSSEILQGNVNYEILRKDRTSYGGGVMIMTHKKYVSTHETYLDTDCEIIGNKISSVKIIKIGMEFFLYLHYLQY